MLSTEMVFDDGAGEGVGVFVGLGTFVGDGLGFGEGEGDASPAVGVAEGGVDGSPDTAFSAFILPCLNLSPVPEMASACVNSLSVTHDGMTHDPFDQMSAATPLAMAVDIELPEYDPYPEFNTVE